MASQAERERAARRGEILEQAMAEARGALREQARRNSPGEVDAEEAIQEASVDFLRTYDGPAGVDAVRWLHVAVKHRGWEQREKYRSQAARVARLRREGGQRDLRAAEPVALIERAEAVAQFVAGLADLKPDERRALVLLGLGCSYREICELQGWTYTKVNRCLTEGRAALRSLGG